ncbi:MAG: phage holin family protein [Bacteroidales bacterium]
MKYFFKIVVNTIAILLSGWILSNGIHIDNALTGVLIAIALILLNTFLRPLLVLLTIPLTLLSLGIFILFINAGMVLIAGSVIDGFTVNGFGWALGFSILVSVFQFLLEIPEKIRNGQIRIQVQKRYDNINENKNDTNNDKDTVDTEYTEYPEEKQDKDEFNK